MSELTPPEYRIEDLPLELAVRIVIHPESGCWEWQHKSGPDPDRYGYVKFRGSLEQVYRVTYKLLAGSIPEDRPHLDHVKARGCIMHACCWPAHLEPVTPRENAERKGLYGWGAAHAGATHCPQDHEYTPQNTYRDRYGRRACRECRRARKRVENMTPAQLKKRRATARAWRERRKAEAA